MQTKLQDFVPYSESLIWKIHNNYFQKKGAQAWLKGEVPYDITSNSCAAMQNAALVLEAVRNAEKCGDLAADEKINILELASGVGMFAINFLEQFARLCRKSGFDYDRRMVFYFTDYSEKTVSEAMKNDFLKAFQEKGIMHFAVVDACNPQSISEIPGGEKINGVKFTAAIANYLHCILPLSILRKKDGKLFEKQIALKLKTDGHDAVAIIDDPTGEKIWPDIEQVFDYKPIETETFFKDKTHFEVIEDTIKSYDTATVIYPYGSFDSIRNFMPMMKAGGIYIISDKGYSDVHQMYGERECTPSYHGNCFAHSFNFPLAENYAVKLGLRAYRTWDPDYGIQTMVIENPAAKGTGDREVRTENSKQNPLFAKFNELFIADNPNRDSNELFMEVLDFEKNKDYENALENLRKLAKKRPQDAKVYFKLGNNYFDTKAYGKALDSYSKGGEYDYLNQYDFDFEIGQVNYFLGDYEKAIEAYGRSIGKKGYNNKFAYFNIGLCNNYLKRFEDADSAFLKVLEIDPEYKRAKECLEENKKHLN
jgi:tetratricopeptide (TPR) repeat protein